MPVEKWLHERYKDTRKRGEWFALAEKDLLNLYAIPGLNNPGRIDVIPPTDEFIVQLYYKIKHWAETSARGQAAGPQDFLREITERSRRLFKVEYAD